MPPKKKAKNASGIESEIDTILGRNQAPTSLDTPALPEDRAISRSESCIGEASACTGQDTSSKADQKDWPSLQGLWNTLSQASTISGLEPVKSVVEGLVELIVLYEEVAQGQNSKEFDQLRVQLECIFDELNHHISSSPVVTTSIDSICWSIKRELKVLKTPQPNPKKRKHEDTGNSAYMVLECYRSIQGHLNRLTRNANMSTWKIVDQLATDSRLRNLAPSLWACYNSEKAIEIERRSCTKDTRVNVLKQMYQWVTAPDSGNIYWMSGMAGTGKTTIAYSLCEWLNTKTNRILCASFFCSRSLPECRDVGRIIPSIAYQLARYSRPFQYALSQAIEKDPDAHTRLPHLQFDSLLVQPLSDEGVREALPENVVVVIDALDECDDVKSTKLILEVLLTKSKDIPIRFVVSSRPEPAIRDQMEENGTWVDARVILHELDSGEVQTDIRTYLKEELVPVNPSESEVNQLVERAGVLFIYAATVIRYVGKDNFMRNPRSRLNTVLDMSKQGGKVQTREIDQLYGAILDATAGDVDLEQTERDDMKLILDTVICAREPLTVGALNNLLRLNDVGRVHSALRPLWSVLHVMRPDMTVTTLHASFPDYLLDPQRSSAWHCDAEVHHQLLAQRCFDCIRDTQPQFNICRLESSYLLDKEVADLDKRVKRFISTELSYACRYWSRHLAVVQPSTESGLVPLLSHFLTTHLLLWMEIRNMTKTASTTVTELTTAKRWAIRRGIPRDTIDLLTDSWRFASTFVSSSVSQSTPHLYISMLPLLPSCSLIRKHYLDRFEGLIEVEGTALERRKRVELAQWYFAFDVSCMACSPDGTRIVVGGEGLHALDAFSGSILHDFDEGYGPWISSIAFSPDSTHLVSGSDIGSIAIWDATNGQLILSLPRAHNDQISSILYSHSGSFIVSASRALDKTIRIWGALTGKPTPPSVIELPDYACCIAISSDDTLLVSGSRDGTVCVWNMQSGQLVLGPMRENTQPISAVAFSPDDSFIVSGSQDGKLVVRDTSTGRMRYSPITYPDGSRLSVSISPDGTAFASTSDKLAEVLIWDAVSGMLLSQLGPFSQDEYHGCFKWASYSPDGTRIIYIVDWGLRLLDAQATARAPDLLLGHTREIATIDISRNGRHLVSGSYDCTVCVWDIAEGVLVLGPLQGHTKKVDIVGFSTAGGRILSCSFDKTIRQWDAQSGAAHGPPIKVPQGVVSATYSPDDAYIASLSDSGQLSLWNSSNGQLVLGPVTGPCRSFYGQVCFSPDGAAVIARYDRARIGVWDLQNGQLVFSRQPVGHHDDRSFELSPNGLYYAQGTPNGRIIIKTIQWGGLVLRDFQAHSGRIVDPLFSPDGTRLAFCSNDETVHVWDLEDGRCVSDPLRLHTSWITSFAFSPDGRYLASASGDKGTCVWDVEPSESLSTNRHTEYTDWVLKEDGWVVSGESRRLFWVPADLRSTLLWPRNTMILGRDGYVRLKFEGARIGEAWAECWRDG